MAVLACPALHAADTASLTPDAFLSRYCLDCHDDDVQKGDRRLDDLPLSVGTDLAIAERWQEVLHQLQLGEMPPAKKKQPTDDERRALLEWIEEQLLQAQSAARTRGGSVAHRRLSRAEYLHTIQDLFGCEGDFDPTTGFPGDEELEGFRNIGSALRTSRHHLEQYLKAADAVLDHAYDLAEVNGKPEVKQWKDSADQMRGLNPAFGLGVISAEKAKGPAYIHLSHGLRNQELIFDSKLYQHLYQGPEVRVHYWQVTGPMRDDKPHPARSLLFAHIAPDEKQVDPARLQAELQALASRLFRREVTADDIAPFASAVQKRLDGKTRYADAARPVFKALLCSSEFLFLTEPESSAKTITPMQLATRLSYFLTAGPPDEQLRALAAKGPLDASSIRRETDRLLTCALGRPLGFADQPALRRLLADWKAQDHKLRELIHLITASDLMHQP